ncbi:MAG: NAD-dependent epimerase/dehydratase family protein [Lentisphaeria bacterium]|jgi:nucleoside-diphosphate-sugar epimerase|nr:NAD-dependent epimerase/dehydratase family protein [Lentisphaeria bacterium]
MAKTKVLMIGGTGVISTDCVRYGLQRDEFEIHLLNRGRTPSFLPQDIPSIVCDIANPDEAKAALEGKEFDIVCDFISFTPEQLAAKLALLRGRCRHYVFISSIMAYRPSVHLLKTESNSRIGNANWEYGWNKSLCENMLRRESAETGMTFTIVRPGYTCSPVRFFSAWSISHWRSWTIADRLLKGKPIILHDDGMQLCTVTHTTDFAKAFVGLWNNPAAVNEDFHITSGEYLTWRRVAEIEAEVLGVEPVFHCVPSERICFVIGHGPGQKVVHASGHDCYDSSKVRAAVPEFKCTTDFATGIAKSVTFYHDNPQFQVIDDWWNGKFDELAKL